MSGHHKDFGKRRPKPPAPTPAPTPPVKRSGQVALLLMGTLAVGGTAYALMPHGQSCPPQATEAAIAGQPQAGCTTSRSSSSGSGGSGRWGFSSSSDSDTRSGSSHAAEASSGHVARGGFGGSAHGFGFSGGG